MTDLRDRVAFVTGASRGIGRAVAVRLAAAGVAVAACAREDHVRGVVDEIVAAGGRAEALSADVTSADSLKAAVRATLDRFGRIDILVNNAGIARDQLLMRMKAEEWDAVIATNLTAVFTCTQAVLRPMLRQRWGRVINVGSVVGQTGNPGQTNYAASKAGLIGFSKALAHEVAARGITVNVVAPGFIETDMTAALGEGAREALAARIPAGRLGRPRMAGGLEVGRVGHDVIVVRGQAGGGRRDVAFDHAHAVQ